MGRRPKPCGAQQVRILFVSLRALLLSLLVSTAAFGAFDQYGGWTGLQGHNTSGFFRVEKINGRYWLVTPANNVYLSFAPCVALYNDTWGGYCPALNYYPNPYNNKAKYNGSQSAWVTKLKGRLQDWGFTGLACWSQSGISEVPETITELSITFRAGGLGCPMIGWFADVWDPRFAQACTSAANLLVANKDDPFRIGSFPDNEIYWSAMYGTPYKTLCDGFIGLPASAHGKQYWVNTFLKGKYATVADLNAAYGTAFVDWTGAGNTVINCTSLPDDDSHPARLADKIDFMEHIADQYYRLTTSAMRAADPNHLVFSTRWAMWWEGYEYPYYFPFNERVWKKAGEYCDVIANNGYREFDQCEQLYQHCSRFFTQAKKPFVITEHSYWANDSYFAYNQWWFPTQMDRALSYEHFVNAILDMTLTDPNDGLPAKPYMGVHWFQFYDEPALGRPDGEKNQYGLLNCKDEAFIPLVEVMKTIHSQVYEHCANGTPIVVPAAPATPNPVTFANRVPSFSWSAVPSAQSYVLLLSPEDGFPEEQTIRIAGITGTSYTHTEPLGWGNWRWAVKAVDAQGRGGHYSKTAQFVVNENNTPQTDSAAMLKCEDPTGWINSDNSHTNGDGWAYAFRDTTVKSEGSSSMRVLLTVNSLNKTTGAKNAGTADIEWRYAGLPLDFPGISDFSFKIYPRRFCNTAGTLVSSSKYVSFRMVDRDSGVVVDQPIDPGGALPVEQWSTVTIPLGTASRRRVNLLSFYVNAGASQLTWDERVVFNVDDMTLAPFVDSTPPTRPVVRDDVFTVSLSELHASWSSSDPESAIVEYQYAIGTTVGGAEIVNWTSVGPATEVTRTGLTLNTGAKYYFSVKARNELDLWSEVGTSQGVYVVTTTTIQEALRKPNGTLVGITGVVTAGTNNFTNIFVVENPDRSCAIKVNRGSNAGIVAQPGNRVRAAGKLNLPAREREREIYDPVVAIEVVNDVVPGALFMPNRSLGGADYSPYSPGLTDGVGTYNLGLLVTICGRVTKRDTAAKYFYVDDGSRLTDGSSYTGVRVFYGATAGSVDCPLEGSYVVVTGISGARYVGGKYVRQLRLRSGADILLL